MQEALQIKIANRQFAIGDVFILANGNLIVLLPIYSESCEEFILGGRRGELLKVYSGGSVKISRLIEILQRESLTLKNSEYIGNIRDATFLTELTKLYSRPYDSIEKTPEQEKQEWGFK